MNKIFLKYGFPLSLVFILLCLAINENTLFAVHWNEEFNLGLDPRLCYYLSIIYLALLTTYISYYFYIKLMEKDPEQYFHKGYFIFSWLLSFPLMMLIVTGPFADQLIVGSIFISFVWAANQIYTRLTLHDKEH